MTGGADLQERELDVRVEGREGQGVRDVVHRLVVVTGRLVQVRGDEPQSRLLRRGQAADLQVLEDRQRLPDPARPAEVGRPRDEELDTVRVGPGEELADLEGELCGVFRGHGGQPPDGTADHAEILVREPPGRPGEVPDGRSLPTRPRHRVAGDLVVQRTAHRGRQRPVEVVAEPGVGEPQRRSVVDEHAAGEGGVDLREEAPHGGPQHAGGDVRVELDPDHRSDLQQCRRPAGDRVPTGWLRRDRDGTDPAQRGDDAVDP
ncbi:hypothetical protein ACFQV8_25375 [Pseudonocardia benzenivorans]